MDCRQSLLILCLIESSLSRRSRSAAYPAAAWAQESSSCCRIRLGRVEQWFHQHVTPPHLVEAMCLSLAATTSVPSARWGMLPPLAFVGRGARSALYDAGTVDEKTIQRAALITLRRAICERFPPGRERRAWLTWAATVRPPRGLGRATATTSATFLPQLEHRIRVASFVSVTDLPAIRASASGSMCRDVPQGQVTRTRKSQKHSSSRLM